MVPLRGAFKVLEANGKGCFKPKCSMTEQLRCYNVPGGGGCICVCGTWVTDAR